jgi:hypothetical protein
MTIWGLYKLISKHVLHIAIQFHACKPANQQAKVKNSMTIYILGRVRGLDYQRITYYRQWEEISSCAAGPAWWLSWNRYHNFYTLTSTTDPEKSWRPFLFLFNFRFHAFTGLQLNHKFQRSREMVVIKHVTRGNKGCLSWIIIIHREQ